MSEFPLVGRERQQRLLADAVDRLAGGHGGLVLLTGEAGIGKTALVQHVLVRARQAGAMVAAGACWDGRATGYWPWVQALRALRLEAPEALWGRARSDAGAGLEELLGERRSAGDPVGDPTAGTAGSSAGAGGQHGAFEVLDALSTVLQVLTRSRPVLIALEDLHWADAATVELLGALARQATLQPLLLVGTYRDDETAAADHPRHADLGALAATASTLPLEGLDAGAVGSLLVRHGVVWDEAGEAPLGGGATVGGVTSMTDVHARTGGNPFFVEQLAQLWAASGSVAATPAGVRAAVDRRLARLPSATAALLTAAAVLGPRFELDLLDRVVRSAGVAELADRTAPTGRGRDRTIPTSTALLGPAAAARLIVEVPGGYRFVHDLVREALGAALPADDARRLHAAAVRALLEAGPPPSPAGGPEVVGVGGAGSVAGEVAHHAVRAVPEISAAEAARLLLDAADHAARRLATAEAADHVQRALALLPDEHADRRTISLRLAALQRRAGQLDAARATCAAVFHAAAASGDSASLAQAALGIHELGELIGEGDDDHMGRLHEARRRVEADRALPPDRRDGLRARLLGAIGRTRAHRLEDDRVGLDELTVEAVKLARDSGDDATLAFCLLARHDAVWGVQPPVQRLRLAEEMEQAAQRASDVEAALLAVLLQYVARLEQGDPRCFATLGRYQAAADAAELPRARYLACTRLVTNAVLQGRFTDADELLERSRALGRRLGEVDVDSVYCDQLWALSRLRGDHGPVAAFIAGHSHPHMAFLEISLANDRGDHERAEQLRVAVEQLGLRWPRWAATIYLATRAEVAARAGDLLRCEQLRAEFAGQTAAWVVLAGGVVAQGPLVYFAGLLDVALGRWDAAVEELEAARVAAERLDARPWVVKARLALVDALLGRDRPGDRGDAAATLAACRHEAERLAMTSVLAAAEALAERLADEGALDDASVPGAPAVASPSVGRCSVTEDVWTLSYAGLTVQLPDSKGLRDLQTLLRQPGTDVEAVTLFDGNRADRPPRHRGADVLDTRARADYRRRLGELDEEIEAALARGADDRARRLDVEREALLSELRAAVGLGGRSRRLGDDVERARKAVTARIRDTLRRLDDRHPVLAEHLRRSISTGTACRYQPAEPVRWETGPI